jgi:Beta-propeller repeat.
MEDGVNYGQNDIVLIKYNSSGTFQWTKQLGSTDEYGYGITSGPANSIFITGYTNGNLDGINNSGNYDMFLVKYDSNGILQ